MRKSGEKWKAGYDPKNSLVAASFRIWPGYKRDFARTDFPRMVIEGVETEFKKIVIVVVYASGESYKVF